jgi:hypothetical protein
MSEEKEIEDVELKATERENRLDPRQKLTWQYYIDPASETFSNAYKSSLKAGYSPNYANQITTSPWFKDKVRRTHLLGKAEKVIDRTFDMDDLDENGKPKADMVRVKADLAKHITKTLGKDEGYSEKNEIVGAGNNVVFLPQELIEKFNLKDSKDHKESKESKESKEDGIKELDSGSNQE